MKYPNPITGGASAGANSKPRSCPNSAPTEYQKPTAKTTQTKRLEKNNLGDGKKDSNIYKPLAFTFSDSITTKKY